MYAFSTVLAYLTTRRDEKGATAVEYGLLVALIAAILVGVIAAVGTDVLGGFNDVEDAVNGSQAP